MMPRKEKRKIGEGFVPLRHRLIESIAFKSLSGRAKIAYIYFLRDIRSGHQEEVVLTFGQAKKYGVCCSPSTFGKVKKELVMHGFLDPVDGGGLNVHAIFRVSDRWKWFENKGRFVVVEYKPGHGSKYFKTAMRDEKKKAEILKARYPK